MVTLYLSSINPGSCQPKVVTPFTAVRNDHNAVSNNADAYTNNTDNEFKTIIPLKGNRFSLRNAKSK